MRNCVRKRLTKSTSWSSSRWITSTWAFVCQSSRNSCARALYNTRHKTHRSQHPQYKLVSGPLALASHRLNNIRADQLTPFRSRFCGCVFKQRNNFWYRNDASLRVHSYDTSYDTYDNSINTASRSTRLQPARTYACTPASSTCSQLQGLLRGSYSCCPCGRTARGANPAFASGNCRSWSFSLWYQSTSGVWYQP